MLLPVHITSLLLGLGCLACSFIAAIFFLIQNISIKRKHFGNLVRSLPSVESLDNYMLRFLTVGFPAMTVGLITGIALAHSSWSSAWASKPDILFFIICWLWYGLLLGVRFGLGWRGKRFSFLNMAGFFTVLFSLFGMQVFFGKGIHHFF